MKREDRSNYIFVGFGVSGPGRKSYKMMSDCWGGGGAGHMEGLSKGCSV